MQNIECKEYLALRKEEGARVYLSNKHRIMSIPPQVLGLQTRKEFLLARKLLIQRNYKTEAQNKMISEWTIPRMLTKAKEQE